MVWELMTAPLRIGMCTARLGFRLTDRAAGVAWRATAHLVGLLAPEEAADHRSDVATAIAVDVVLAPPSATAATPADVQPAAATPPPAPAPQAAEETVHEPEITVAHVSEEPELVEAFAEPGAEDGAGAAVHVREPWKGYGQMTAREVLARLADAGPEEVAAVELYERSHRARQSVLAAADRQLRRETAAAHAHTAITQNG